MIFYQQKFIDIDQIEPFIHILEELDTKQRKIRSLRGFFLYILEIMDDGKDFQILTTNLQPPFWRNLRKILRQNKKAVLLEFLFGKDQDQKPDSIGLEELQNQVNSLQERIVELENQNLVMEGKLNMLSAAPRSSKFDTSIRKEYHTTSDQNHAQNQQNFLPLSQISEQERVEIIQKGFQLQAKGKISLKKYYEGIQEYSLFQFKGYSIKYESIRRTKSYQQLKPGERI